MVAQYDDSPASKILDVAEHTERIGPAVDKIADEPKTITAWIKSDMVEKTLQGIMASLHIADCIRRHAYREFNRTRRSYPRTVEFLGWFAVV